MSAPKDKLFRPLRDLRISVTDRCNFRCNYCMPNAEYQKIARGELLTFEELERASKIFLKLGVRKIRLTGGEPLLRNQLEVLVRKISALPELEDLALTTNGAFLKEKAGLLKSAGLKRLNVSLDSLDPDKFKQITQNGDLSRVLDGLFAAQEVGFRLIKINTVVMRGFNEEEIAELVKFSRQNGFAIRFIEYMDVGNANSWVPEKFVPAQEILTQIEKSFPLQQISKDAGEGTELLYRFLDGAGEVGIIASVSKPFCAGCTRARLTADGKLVTCLFSEKGIDVKERLRAGASDTELENFISSIWKGRIDRYSEERWQALQENRYSPHQRAKIEMITLGG